jgi:hypothetical protein
VPGHRACLGASPGLPPFPDRRQTREPEEGVKTVFACTLTRHFTSSGCPAVTDGLDAIRRRSIIAKRRGMGEPFCTFPGYVVVGQAVTVKSWRAVAAGDGVHGEPLLQVRAGLQGSRHGGLVPMGQGSSCGEPEMCGRAVVLLLRRKNRILRSADTCLGEQLPDLADLVRGRASTLELVVISPVLWMVSDRPDGELLNPERSV